MQATAIPYAQLKAGAQVRAKVGLLFMRQYDLVSRVWEGEILELKWWGKEHLIQKLIDKSRLGTLRAVKVAAIPVMAESTYCHRCGQYIERESMRAFGYGFGCAERIGIPAWDHFTDEQIDDFRKNLPLQFQQEMWIPIDHSEFEVLRDAPPPEPEQQRDYDVRFTVEDNEIVVMTTPDFRWVVRSVPGWKWDARYNVWRFPRSPSIAGHLKAAFNGYRRRGTKEFLALVQQFESQHEAQQIKTIENLPEIPWIKGGGWQHQRQAWAYLVRTLTGKNPYRKGSYDES